MVKFYYISYFSTQLPTKCDSVLLYNGTFYYIFKWFWLLESFFFIRSSTLPLEVCTENSWKELSSVQFSRSVVSDSATPWFEACQATLSITNSWSLLKLMSIELAMPSSHLILCCPPLFLPPIPPSISLFQWVSSSHDVAKVLEFHL